MHFSDDDLAAALRRKDPGPDFTQRVLSAVEAGRASAEGTRAKTSRWWRFRFSPAFAAVAVAIVLVAASWIGVWRYREHQAQIARAEQARAQAILALRITNAKLNHVLRQVNQQEAPQPKVRRQTL
jgi:hypothetical protein